jgi:hypothetical protein
MGVAGQISQYRFGSGEGPFAVDVPSDLAQRRQEGGEGSALGEMTMGLRNSSGSLAMLAAMRRASSCVSRCAAARRFGPFPILSETQIEQRHVIGFQLNRNDCTYLSQISFMVTGRRVQKRVGFDFQMERRACRQLTSNRMDPLLLLALHYLAARFSRGGGEGRRSASLFDCQDRLR